MEIYYKNLSSKNLLDTTFFGELFLGKTENIKKRAV
jgi:hypothetical protein